MTRTRSRTLVCCLLPLLLGSGCNAVLGIERIGNSKGNDKGNNADGGDISMTLPQQGSASGSDGGATQNDASIVLPAAGSGSAMPPPSSSAGAGAAGSGSLPELAGAGGAGITGTAGAAGMPADNVTTPQSGPVQGRVIEYWRQAVPNAKVRIGDQSTMTDADGRFSFASAPATYDVTISFVHNYRNVPSQVTWQVQGLARRDPTIQMYRGVIGRSGAAHADIDNVSFPLAGTQRININWTSPEGDFYSSQTSASVGPIDIDWSGPAVSVGTARALLFDVSDMLGLPTAYHAYDSIPLPLEENGAPAPMRFDLTAETIETGTIDGTITGPNQNRSLMAYARFPDNSALELVSAYSVNDTFSYLVPKLPDATFAVSIQDTANFRDQGLAAAYIDNIAPGQTIALALPAVPALLAPADGKAALGADELFSWRTDAKVSLLCAAADQNYDISCVLTSKSEARLPARPDTDFVPAANAAYYWSVETHDSYATIDEACAEQGYLSAYAANTRLRGPKRGNGFYALSALRAYVTAP